MARYVYVLKAPPSPGGYGLGYAGPVVEGAMAAAGLLVLVLIAGLLAAGKGAARVNEPMHSGPPGMPPEASEGRTSDWSAARGFLLAIAAAGGFVWAYATSQHLLAGRLPGAGFFGLGFALAYWGATSRRQAGGRAYPIPREADEERPRGSDERTAKDVR